MQVVSRILPPSYVFESLRAVVGGRPVCWISLLWASLLAVLYIFLAGLIFKSTYNHAVRTGLIARYSAESLS
ncbi:MAG: hypothetical protein ABIH71_07575 [Candidatus Omnitrophota bacterium]|nr:hypothetical protein [Candidatus Omnitrophota bacterium]